MLSEHLEDEQTVALTRGTLPRVNLLPLEIGERVRFRRIQYGLGLGVLGALGVAVLLYALASGSVADANDELTASTTTGSELQAETAKFSEVKAVYAQAAAAEAQLTLAMGQEVRYSQLLNDLSLSVPENVWVKNITYNQADAAAVPVAGAPLPGAEPGIGTVTFDGVGFSHDDVATWLDSLATQKSYADPYFSNSTETLIGTRTAVEFNSTTTLTPAALSGRYTAPQGG